MTKNILVANSGSSSIKFQLFAITGQEQLKRLMKGQIEGIATHPRLSAKDTNGAVLIDRSWEAADVSSAPVALAKIIEFLRAQIDGSLPIAVGHRVVHGGPDYNEPILIDKALVDRLEQFCPLAPLHQPHNLAPIRAILERHPEVPQVACFDTAFHHGHPEVADHYAIPQRLHADGVRRYGFHGLSYEYIAQRLAEVAPDIAQGRVVVAHLGSGASMCAISGGKSLDSTMGFTGLDGLPMGTRPGQIDAGVLLYLLSEKGMSTQELEHFLYRECGLKGLSGISNDVRELLASEDPGARFALDHFVYRIALFTGMLASAMGGIDAFVFTAGVGENAPAIREAVARRLQWLGLELDVEANAAGEQLISRPQSRVACYVIPTDEELMIARHTLCVLRERSSTPLERKQA